MSQLLHDGLRPRRFKMGRTIVALMLREMSTTYGRSPGGYVWAILEPIGAIAMMTLIIAVGLRIRVPGLGVSFPFFFATGILPLNLFQRVQQRTSVALNFSKALLFYPGVTYIDAILARFLVTLLTQLMVTYLVLTGLILIFDTRAVFQAGPVLTGVLMVASLGLGIGTLNCYLFAAFPLWQSLWGILTTPLFFMSGIFFVYESLPVFARDVLWYNPVLHAVSLMRAGFYPTYHASFVSPLYVFSIALIAFAFGLMLLSRHYRSIINQ